jgi:ribonuclease D
MASKKSQPHYELITSSEQLIKFCDRSKDSQFAGFDTEFVSENQYRPELCLIQIATDDELAIIDTVAINDLQPFWEWLTSSDRTTLVHAAREEFLFCIRDCGKWPANLFDVQLAAGMVGMEYPASYGNLVQRTLGIEVDKGETRTDWRRRPLTDRQIDYALQDVIHLKAIYDRLTKKLNARQRLPWMKEEMTQWQEDLEKTVTEPQWRRVSGIASLKPPALAIVRELWLLRDKEAERQNRSPRRVLPDDLIVELARRANPNPKQLKAIRGFESRVSRFLSDDIGKAIQKAKELPDSQLPPRIRRNKSANLGLLGQFLTTALKIVCKTESIAPGIVGSADDVRTMAAWKLGMLKLKEPPELSRGWRAEIVGTLVERILDGTYAIRVGDPKSDEPLILESLKNE